MNNGATVESQNEEANGNETANISQSFCSFLFPEMILNIIRFSFLIRHFGVN